MIDAPGPWGSGPFVLTEGASSCEVTPAIISPRPFMCTWLPKPDRSPIVTLEANPYYFEPERGPRVGRIRFRNDLTPAAALDLCLNTEGEVDLVTEVSARDAGRVQSSPYAKLVAVESPRVIAGTFNRWLTEIPFSDRRLREALNLAVDRQQLVREGLAGYAVPSAGLTPAWFREFPAGIYPRPFDPERARALLQASGWPAGRSLRIAAPTKLAPLAQLLARQFETALRIGVQVKEIPADRQLAEQRVLVEKKLMPNWDLLLAFIDAPFFAEMSPVYFHREFFGVDGTLRAGPPIPEFDTLFRLLAAQTNAESRLQIASQI
ncbi:MAG TPA: ABC transporter substrate-binding protein, partial [Symbiobacteriaceae bacterium]|nr:ABC transporter substrate-binding protein [Symbiobacteriaceae bacterium]